MKKNILLAVALSLALQSHGQAVWGNAVLNSYIVAAASESAEPSNVLWAEVEDNGWVLKVHIDGYDTAGAFDFGFATNNTGASKVKLDLTSMGFDTNGAATTISRTVYGTKELRLPYPDYATDDITGVGGGVTIRLALSDWVYDYDSNLVCSISADWYSNNTANATVAITNNSVQSYPKIVGNWTWKGFRVIDEENLTLRAVGFHAHAQNGSPLRMVEFRVKDSGDNWFTNRQTEMRIDARMPDAVPFAEYYADFATNTLAAGLVTCDVRMYPWVGDTNTILDSAASGFAEPTAYITTLTNAVNFARVRAIVATNGNDTTGVAAYPAYWATNTSPPAFATIGKAMLAIYNTNAAVLSRAGMGGGIVYLDQGNHLYLGSTLTLANAQDIETVVTRLPSVDKSAAVIAGPGTDQRGKDDSDTIRFYDITLDSTGSTLFSQSRQWWLDNVDLKNWNGTTLWQQTTAAGGSAVITHSTISNLTLQGIAPYSTQLAPPSLVRGNRITGDSSQLRVFTVVGNIRESSATNFIIRSDLSGQKPAGFPFIVYNNKFMGIRNATGLQWGQYIPLTNGSATVQNIWEYAGANSVNHYWQAFNDVSYTNCIFWNNTTVGTRLLYGYNSSGTDPLWRWGFSTLNNIAARLAIKGDTFTGDGGADGGRVGNWALMWGVGKQGDAMLNTTNIATTGDFDYEFNGLGGWAYQSGYGPTNYAMFATNGGFDGITVNAPDGDYRLLSTSPLHTMNQTRWVLPYDIAGEARSSDDPPGAHAEVVE